MLQPLHSASLDRGRLDHPITDQRPILWPLLQLPGDNSQSTGRPSPWASSRPESCGPSSRELMNLMDHSLTLASPNGPETSCCRQPATLQPGLRHSKPPPANSSHQSPQPESQFV